MSPEAPEETSALAVLRRAPLFTRPPLAPLSLRLLLTLTFMRLVLLPSSLVGSDLQLPSLRS